MARSRRVGSISRAVMLLCSHLTCSFGDCPLVAQGILLVYDVTDRNSFNSIKTWVEEIERNADKAVNKVLIGNKCDVDDSARVRY